MEGNGRDHGYASTERDTDLDSISFSRWRDIEDAVPKNISRPIWFSGHLAPMQADELQDDEPLFCPVRVLGTNFLLAVSPFQAYNESRPHWTGDIHAHSHGQVVVKADTRDEAIARLIDYAKDIMTDEDAVIACLNATDREFLRQAREAGATVCLENNRSERDKGVTIEIRNDLSTDEHPFQQSFLLSAYARPEGCHWDCWYCFSGIDAPWSRQRGIEVDASKGFSVARIVEDTGTCDCCGKRIPVDEVETAGFANGTCKECNFVYHQKLRREGWTDR